MTEILSEPPRRYSSLTEDELRPEWGDSKDVTRIFGFRETHVWHLWSTAKIKGVLIPGPRGKRGKRLYSFDSIQQYIAECGSTNPTGKAPYYPRRKKAESEKKFARLRRTKKEAA